MFDLDLLRDLVERHGPVARVIIASVKGSAPRGVGTSMVVWADGQHGTIGGGTLEFHATQEARARLQTRDTNVARLALGPALNQCCGGAVTLATEIFDAQALDAITGQTFARRIEGAADIPAPMERALNRALAMDQPSPVTFSGGWLSEPLTRMTTPIIIYGAGHVGVALATILDPLDQFDVTIADNRKTTDRLYPDAQDIASAVSNAPDHAFHLVMTHAHDQDLEICHTLLSRRTGGIGLIGSATKWARFRKRLMALGHSPQTIARITSPIGDPQLGKHPQAIALGVASALLREVRTPITKREAV